MAARLAPDRSRCCRAAPRSRRSGRHRAGWDGPRGIRPRCTLARWTSTWLPSTSSCATRSATSCATRSRPLVDEHERARRFPVEIVRRLGEMGWLGIPIPEDEGGAGPRHAGLCDRDRGDRPGVGLARPDRRRPHEPRLRPAPPGRDARAEVPATSSRWPSGRVLGGYGLTEPGAGSDAGGTRTTARHEDGPDGGTLGHRRRQAVHHERRAGRDLHRHRPDRGRPSGEAEISAFIVEADAPGFSIGRLEEKMGLHASATGELRVHRRCGCRRPNMLGERGTGFRTFLRILDGGRISIGALAVGTGPGGARRVDPVRPGRASSSAARSGRSRASRSSSPTWRPRSRRPGRWSGGPPGSRTGARLLARRGPGEAVRVRGELAGDECRDPGPRRVRLRRGVQGRALPARREADRDRGGDEPDPAPRDRPADPRTCGSSDPAAQSTW